MKNEKNSQNSESVKIAYLPLSSLNKKSNSLIRGRKTMKSNGTYFRKPWCICWTLINLGMIINQQHYFFTFFGSSAFTSETIFSFFGSTLVCLAVFTPGLSWFSVGGETGVGFSSVDRTKEKIPEVKVRFTFDSSLEGFINICRIGSRCFNKNEPMLVGVLISRCWLYLPQIWQIALISYIIWNIPTSITTMLGSALSLSSLSHLSTCSKLLVFVTS